MRLALLVVVFCFAVGGPAPALAAGDADGAAKALRDRPPARPTEVAIAVLVLDIDRINELDEDFELEGMLLLRWKDPRLAFDPKKEGTEARLASPEEIWWPEVRITNVRNVRSRAMAKAEILPDGSVAYTERFNTTISVPLDLRKFPFDRQVLRVDIESFKFDARHVTFVADRERGRVGSDVDLDEWGVGRVTTRVERRRSELDGRDYSRYVFEMGVERKWGFYLWKILIPLRACWRPSPSASPSARACRGSPTSPSSTGSSSSPTRASSCR
ncbi:MAG: hypothetical protein HY727_21760 [Candidatus Rokubacteria bacterium]|nr:hypothetical protein [Candidatus Rokubacteria bacterium]